MPLYEYECTACHRRTEKIQKFSDPEITTCPFCSGHLERVISAPAISFKGGGWYADGYGNAKPAPSGDSKGKPSDESKGKPSGETKGSDSTAKPAADSTASSPATPAPAPAPSSTADKK